jgi:hypothetical protein
MHLFPRPIVRVAQARRSRAALRKLQGLDYRELDDELGMDRRSLPEMVRSALKPGLTTWMVTRAVSLRPF